MIKPIVTKNNLSEAKGLFAFCCYWNSSSNINVFTLFLAQSCSTWFTPRRLIKKNIWSGIEEIHFSTSLRVLIDFSRCSLEKSSAISRDFPNIFQLVFAFHSTKLKKLLFTCSADAILCFAETNIRK